MSKNRKSLPVRGLEEINDPCYRYKMEPINLVQQRTKCVITNIKDVANDVSMNKTDLKTAAMMIEYFKKRFSIPIKCDKDLVNLEIKGVTVDELQNAVYEFIEYFVICPTCRNPETELSKDNDNIYITCKACSHHSKIDDTQKMVKNFLKILG